MSEIYQKFLKISLTSWRSDVAHSQKYYNKVYQIHKSLYTSYVRVNLVKRNSQTCITLMIRNTVIKNYVKKSSYSKYKKKLCT